MTLPTEQNLLGFAPFAAASARVRVAEAEPLRAALRIAEALVRSGESDEVALFYGLAKESQSIGPVAIHLAFRLIVQSLQERGRRFGGVTPDEMRRAFLEVGNGTMPIEQLRHWIDERTTLPR